MKKINLVLWLGMLLLGLVSGASHAESPRARFDKMLAQLQQSPNDSALREKVIKTAHGMKPAPAVPEEARRHFVKASVLEKDAKTPEDYSLPAEEYRQALAVAPWWGEAYLKLSAALESSGKFDEAKDNLKYYLMSSPPAKDAREAQDRIYAIEAKQEKAAKQKAQDDAKYGWLLGSWNSRMCLYITKYNLNTCEDSRFNVGWGSVDTKREGNTVKFISPSPDPRTPDGMLRATVADSGEIKWERWQPVMDSRFICPGDGTWIAVTPTISPDKQSIYIETTSYLYPQCAVNGTAQLTLRR